MIAKRAVHRFRFAKCVQVLQAANIVACVVFWVVGFVAERCQAQAGEARPQHGTAHVSFNATQLSNGLRLLVVEDPSKMVVRIFQYHGMGSGQDPAGKEGLAHLFEHLMMKAWDSDLSGDRSLELYTLYRNAHTSFASTVYETWCLPHYLADVLQLEAERLKRFVPLPAIFAREKSVVRKERALRDRVNAEIDLEETILQAAYVGHPYGRPIAGTDSTIASIAIEDLEAFHAQFVSPQNVILVVLGPVAYSDVRALVDTNYGSIPPHPGFAPVEHPEPPARARATTEIYRHDAEGFRARIGFRLPARSKEEIVMGSFVRDLLSGPETRESLIYLPGEWFLSVGVAWLYGKTPDDAGPDRIRQAAWSYLWEKIEERVVVATQPDSFEACRKRALERATDVENLLRLGPTLFVDEDVRWYVKRDSILQSFTVNDVKSCLSQWIVLENSSSGAMQGRGSKRAVALDLESPRGADALGSPAPDPRSTLTVGEIAPVLSDLLGARRRPLVKRRLSNEIPVVGIVFADDDHGVWLGGYKTHSRVKRAEGKPGLMRFYDLVLSADPKPNARAWKPLKHHIRFGATTQSVVFFGGAKSNATGELARSMVDRMVTREFNVATWRFVREFASYYLRPKGFAPDLEAKVKRWTVLWGEEHPVLGEWHGDPREARKWKYDDLREIHKNIMKTGDLRLIATGSFDPDSLVEELERTFGALEDFRERHEWSPSKVEQPRPFVTVVSAFDRRDCRIAITFRPISRAETPPLEWAALEVLRECIRTRIYSRLRHREGLCYTLWTTEGFAGDHVVLELHASTLPAATRRTIEVTIDELSRLATLGIDEDLLARGKLLAAKRLFRSMNDDAGGAFEALQGMALLGEPPDDPIAAVIAVDRSRVNSLLQASIVPDQSIVSVCGPILEDEAEPLFRAMFSRE